MHSIVSIVSIVQEMPGPGRHGCLGWAGLGWAGVTFTAQGIDLGTGLVAASVQHGPHQLSTIHLTISAIVTIYNISNSI